MSVNDGLTKRSRARDDPTVRLTFMKRARVGRQREPFVSLAPLHAMRRIRVVNEVIRKLRWL